MDHEILLCCPLRYAAHPEVLGLNEESFSHQFWLAIESFCDRARHRAHLHPWREIWVVGAEDMAGINLAHALIHDNPHTHIVLFSEEKSGSYYSRVHAAGIEAHGSLSGFASYFTQMKARILAESAQLSDGMAHAQVREQVSEIAVHEMLQQDVSDEFAHDELRQVADRCMHENLQQGVRDRRLEPTSSQQASSHVVDIVSEGVLQSKLADSVFVQARTPDSVVAHNRAQDPVFAHGVSGHVNRHSSCVISVVGAGGGVGTSTISTLMAFASAKLGNKTALIDADFQLGDLAHVMGTEHPLRSSEILEKPARLDAPGIVGDTGVPVLVAAPLHVEESEVIRAHIHALIDEVTRRFDVVIIDTALMWDDAHIEILSRSHASVFVIDQRPSSLRACRHLLSLCARCGVATHAFTYVINRCSRKALFSSIDVSCSLKGAHVHELCEAGPHLEELFGLGRPQDYFDEQPKFVSQIIDLTREILPDQLVKQQIAPAGRPHGLFRKRRGI